MSQGVLGLRGLRVRVFGVRSLGFRGLRVEFFGLGVYGFSWG